MSERIIVPFDPKGQEVVLVEFQDNWADECDFSGFQVMTLPDFEDWKSKIPEGEVNISFGTNEDNTYENKDAFLDTISVRVITEEEAWILRKLFPSSRFECGEFDPKTGKHSWYKDIKNAGFGYFPNFNRYY